MDPSSSAMDVSLDPVSLRAAALSTLKSKRRKPVPDKTITMPPSRTTHASDFQLDYGQEDVMVVDPPPPPSPKFPQKFSQKVPMATKDVQMREEGEISDEEDILRPALLPKQSPPPPLRKSNSPIPAKALSPQPVKVVEAKSASPLQKSLAPEERPPLSLLERFSGYAPSNEELETDIAMSGAHGPGFDSSLSLLGPDRVRPGLLLTMDEYDTAKDIILDLLGWGVPPEFLVDCGLTKALVFYVFTELNLRLPDNFDSSDIIPYDPESFAQRQQSVLMPPPPPPENNRTIDTTVEVSPRAITPPLQPPTTATWDSPSNTDLHDMERQRRQELLARKAVQASRRLKQSTSMGTSPSISQSHSSCSDRPMEAVISTEVIEDFLNSIGPVRDPEHLNGVLPSPSDEDDAQIIVVPRQSPTSAGLSSANTDDPSISPSSRARSHGPPLSAEPPPTSSDSVTSVTSNFLQLSEVKFTIDSTSPLSPPSTHPRRGVRPVASDFVDFDSAPRGNESNSRLEPPAFSSGIIRRLNLAANFRDIGSRRCVIDLSDSEDDDEPDIKDHLQQSQSIVEDQPWLKRDRRSKASNYHPPTSTKSSLPGNQSPAALKMKELEIRRMRELIAKREEETRLKKIASAKSSFNADTSGSLPPVNHSPSLKQEDVDVIMNPATGERNGFGNYRNSESASPPPRSVSKSSNDEDANRVQDDPLNRDPALVHSYQDSVSSAQEAQVTAKQETRFVQETEQFSAFKQGMVDADPEPSPSTQVNQETVLAIPKQDANELVSETPTAFNGSNNQPDDGKHEVYNSIFELYPSLRGHSRPISSDLEFPSHLSSHSSLHIYPSTRTFSSSSSVFTEPSYLSSASSSSFVPEFNLKALKLAAIGKILHPSKPICRYEVPGGGTCRDEGCDDVHLSRLQGASVEPSDRDVAEYLFNTLPKEWLTHYQVSSASKIVAALQDSRGHSSLEHRVDQALLTLGSRPA